MRAKILTSFSTSAQPGAAARRLSGRARRWASWARALAGRFRAGRLRGVGTALVLQRWVRGPSAGLPVGRQGGGERTRVANTLFAPRLHLTISPLVRLGGWPGPCLTLRPAVLPGGMAGPEARPGMAVRTARTVAVSGHALARDGGVAQAPRVPRVPLERARARCSASAAAFPPGLSLTLAHAGRSLPRASSGELLALAGRVAARGRRQETPFQRPAATLHRPSPPELASEAAAEASTRPHRRVPAGRPSAGPALSAGMPGTFTATPGELDRLTEQVVRRIDRRMDAWRERTGRVR